MSAGHQNALMEEVMQRMTRLQAAGNQLGSESRNGHKQFLQKQLEELKAKEAQYARKLMIREAVGLDLLFLLDITGSMKPYSDGVVNQITHIITCLEAMFKYSKGNIRVGVVGYRDLQLEPRFEILPFKSVTASGDDCIKDWLNKLKFFTDKENDFPEDVHGGLEQAASAQLGWKNAARTIVHIADAPGHGTRLSAGSDARWVDSHPNYDADGSELVRLLTKLRVDIKVLDYRFIHIVSKEGRQPYTLAMLQEFRKACGDPAWIREAEWQGDTEMALEVIAAASESIQISVVALRSGVQVAPLERTYTLDPQEPDWDNVPALPLNSCVRHNTEMLRSLETLLTLIRSNKHIMTLEVPDIEQARLRIAPNPFAKGKHRLAYYGRYYPDGLDGTEMQEVVLKEFISCEGKANSAIAYKAQLETQTVASFLANDFNKHAAEAAGSLSVPLVRYAPCELISVKTTTIANKGGVVAPKLIRFLLMEPLILGDMHKFNNNYGAVELSDPQPHLQAFSHWTYEVTEKMLMVTDLQGFRTLGEKDDDLEIVLVDPAIHCTQPDFFTSTNLASFGGFEAFLHSHTSATLGKFELHGPICEALLPSCCRFRSQQHALASDVGEGSGGTAKRVPFTGGLWRNGNNRRRHSNGPSQPGSHRGGGRNAMPRPPRQPTAAPRPAAAGDTCTAAAGGSAQQHVSMETTCSIQVRVDAVKKASKIHKYCKNELGKIGLPVPSNLNTAIELCAVKGLFKPAFAALCHEDRIAANNARHVW